MHGVILLAVVVVVLVVCVGWTGWKKRCLSCALYSYTIIQFVTPLYIIMLWSPRPLQQPNSGWEHSHQDPRSARNTIFTSYHNLLAHFNRCLINISKDQQKHQQNHAKIYQKPLQFIATGWSYYRLAEHFSWWGHGGTSSQAQKLRKKTPGFQRNPCMKCGNFQKCQVETYTLQLFNIAMENHHFSVSVNHLFLWAIFHGYVKSPEGMFYLRIFTPEMSDLVRVHPASVRWCGFTMFHLWKIWGYPRYPTHNMR